MEFWEVMEIKSCKYMIYATHNVVHLDGNLKPFNVNVIRYRLFMIPVLYIRLLWSACSPPCFRWVWYLWLHYGNERFIQNELPFFKIWLSLVQHQPTYSRDIWKIIYSHFDISYSGQLKKKGRYCCPVVFFVIKNLILIQDLGSYDLAYATVPFFCVYTINMIFYAPAMKWPGV
jgi:hypothetical protein